MQSFKSGKNHLLSAASRAGLANRLSPRWLGTVKFMALMLLISGCELGDSDSEIKEEQAPVRQTAMPERFSLSIDDDAGLSEAKATTARP